jgi:hypothetical protein
VQSACHSCFHRKKCSSRGILFSFISFFYPTGMLSRGLLRSSSRLCRAVLSHSKRAPSAWQLPNTAPPLLSSASSIPIAPMAIARGFSSSSSSSADREQGLFSAADNEKFQFLEVSIKTDGVVVLKLHNPSQLNAMTIEMGREFEQVATRLYVESMNNNYNIRAVVITGAGSAFSAGTRRECVCGVYVCLLKSSCSVLCLRHEVDSTTHRRRFAVSA